MMYDYLMNQSTAALNQFPVAFTKKGDFDLGVVARSTTAVGGAGKLRVTWIWLWSPIRGPQGDVDLGVVAHSTTAVGGIKDY